MPWMETDPMQERKRFISEAQGGLFSFSELCSRHGISRKTGYKWVGRYELEGPDGMADHSHRPRSCPHATELHVLEAALKLRRNRPRWGAGKILGYLAELHPDWADAVFDELPGMDGQSGEIIDGAEDRAHDQPCEPDQAVARPSVAPDIRRVIALRRLS